MNPCGLMLNSNSISDSQWAITFDSAKTPHIEKKI